MSQKCVEVVIGRLATDERLRSRFLMDPAGTLHALQQSGFDLNPAEIDALLAMPIDAWAAMAGWIHPRLQKVALNGDGHGP